MINFLTRYEIVLNGLLLKEDIYVDSEKMIGTEENSPEILFKDIINSFLNIEGCQKYDLHMYRKIIVIWSYLYAKFVTTGFFFTNFSAYYKMLPFIFIIKIISLILSCVNSESE